MSTSNIGNTIYKLRTIKGLTQDQLAKKANIHRVTISDIERGIVSPSLDIISSIANAFKMQLSEFFTVDEQRKSLKIHQPFNGNLGDHLISELQSNKYKRLTITVAYAKTSGVSRLRPFLETFKSKGGEINCFIGIDQKNTSYEALIELLDLSDNLYVIHNENFSHTYHPKVYMLDNNIDNPSNVWLSIGSNNLTSGGLFINYESCSIDFLDTSNFWDKKAYKDTLDLFNRYSDINNNLSLFIKSSLIIDKLLEDNYIKTEQQLKISSIKTSSKSTKKPMFGSESFKAPSIEVTRNDHESNDGNNNFNEKNSPTNTSSKNDDTTTTSSSNSTLASVISNSDIDETFWFEMRKSTGGSRNILDLSSTGKLRYGSVLNTKYSLGDNDVIHGGVTFFDIDATNHSTIKDITITYNGNDYYPSTLLYASNNQSWRLQLKGDSSTDNKALSQYGISDFVNNVLIFHKISTDHYLLEVVNSSHLQNLMASSIFWATNGTPKTSKAFGKLK